MANKDFKVKNKLQVAGITSAGPLLSDSSGNVDSTTLIPTQYGGTGTSTSPNAGQVLYSASGTNYAATTFSTLPGVYDVGTHAQRPGSPTAGQLYFNTDKKAFEVWTGSAWVSVAVNGAVPLAPTIGTATVSGLTASVPFTGPADFGDAAITTYTATSNPGGITASNASSPISISGLTANTSYTFTVTATNSYGTSNPSAASNSITTATTPGAPTSVTVTDPGTDGYAAVSWTAPASNGGSAITDYIIQYSSNSGSSWTTFSDGTSTSTSATVTGLTLNTAYIFRVAAVNAIGTGSYSTASASFTPVSHLIEAMDQLQVITVGAAGASSVSFTSIPSTYKHLQIRSLTRCTLADSGVQNQVMAFNGDTTSTNYRTHILQGTGTVAEAESVQTSTFYSSAGLTIGDTSTAGTYAATVIDILDYQNTNKNTTVRSLSGVDTNGYGLISLRSSVWLNTAAITSIAINPRSAGNFKQYSSFALYGIKGA